MQWREKFLIMYTTLFHSIVLFVVFDIAVLHFQNLGAYLNLFGLEYNSHNPASRAIAIQSGNRQDFIFSCFNMEGLSLELNLATLLFISLFFVFFERLFIQNIGDLSTYTYDANVLKFTGI